MNLHPDTPPNSPRTQENDEHDELMELRVIDAGSRPLKKNSSCFECEEYAALIERKNVEIRSLKKELKKANQKIWYLEKIKRNLHAAFLQLKKEKIIDAKQREFLEVI